MMGEMECGVNSVHADGNHPQGPWSVSTNLRALGWQPPQAPPCRTAGADMAIHHWAPTGSRATQADWRGG